MTDFALVHADDALLDALGAAVVMVDPSDDLALLLLAWRQDVDAEPIPLTGADLVAAVAWAARTSA